MGWCSDLFCNITFNRKTYNSTYEVQSDIDELNGYIKVTERRLMDLAIMTEPNKFFTNPELDILGTISGEVKEQLECLEEYYIERAKLMLLLDKWGACHTKDGLAINPPDGIDWDSAYFDGDFINSVGRPNADSEIE